MMHVKHIQETSLSRSTLFKQVIPVTALSSFNLRPVLFRMRSRCGFKGQHNHWRRVRLLGNGFEKQVYHPVVYAAVTYQEDSNEC